MGARKEHAVKVKELIALLQKVDPEAAIESDEGYDLDHVTYHSGMKRVALGSFDSGETCYEFGWEELAP